MIRADGAAAVTQVLRAHPTAPRGLRQRRAPEGHDPGAQAALQPLRRDVRSHKRGRDVHAPLGLAAAVEAAPLVPLVLGQVVLLRRERSLGGRGVRAGLAPRRRRRPRALILLEVVLSLHRVHLARAEPASRGRDEEAVEGHGESLFQGHHARAGRAPARHRPIRRVEALVRRGFGSRRVKRLLRVGHRGKRARLPGAVRRQPHHGELPGRARVGERVERLGRNRRAHAREPVHDALNPGVVCAVEHDERINLANHLLGQVGRRLRGTQERANAAAGLKAPGEPSHGVESSAERQVRRVEAEVGDASLLKERGGGVERGI